MDVAIFITLINIVITDGMFRYIIQTMWSAIKSTIQEPGSELRHKSQQYHQSRDLCQNQLHEISY